jgi:hypothetical protein
MNFHLPDSSRLEKDQVGKESEMGGYESDVVGDSDAR